MNVVDVAQLWLTRLVPRAKDRRALGVGVVLMGSMLLLGRGLPAWLQWEEAERVATQESNRRLEATLAAVRERHSLTAVRAKVAERLEALSSAYLHAPTSAVAGAALASMISEMGDESGIRVTSALVRSDTMTKAPFARIAVRISATGDVEGLADYLRSIESAEQLLAVRELSVAQSEPGAPDSRAESLHFEMLVEGLVRLDPPRTSAIAMLVKK